MKAFGRRGFQLRTASAETRIAYTAFLLLTAPGVGTLLALATRAGWRADAIATHYRGGDSEMSFPKSFWQLVEVSHAHLFTMPIVVLVLAHLLQATLAPRGLRVGLSVAMFASVALDATGPWAVRYVAAWCAYPLLVAWALLAASLLAVIALSLASMWAPERWLGPPAPHPVHAEKS